MSNGPRPSPETLASPFPQELDPDSYTAERLKHATPEHLYLTTRRAFIGPVPEGWLKAHRKTWIQHSFGGNYSSRAATFRAAENVGRHRRFTGLHHGTQSNGRLSASFPQPGDLDIDGDTRNAAIVDSQNGGSPLITEDDPAAVSPLDETESSPQDGPGLQTDQKSKAVDGVEIRSNSGPQHVNGHMTSDRSSERGDDSTSQRPQLPAVLTTETFKTAREERTRNSLEEDPGDARSPVHLGVKTDDDGASAQRGPSFGSYGEGTGSDPSDGPERSSSRAALLRRTSTPKDRRDEAGKTESKAQVLLAKARRKSSRASEDPDIQDEEVSSEPRGKSRVLFDLPEDSTRKQMLQKALTASSELQDRASRVLKRNSAEGQIIKMEKMLIRVDSTPEKKLPPEYDENCSQSIVSRVVERWREYMVVVRRTTDGSEAAFVLQMYKSRVIPAVDASRRKKRATYEVFLGRKTTGVNLYSSLDKTAVLWTTTKVGSTIYILRPKSNADAAEWYTFLRSLLGSKRPTHLDISIPDLMIHLRVENPFLRFKDEEIDNNDELAERIERYKDNIANNLIRRCMEMLELRPEYSRVIQEWLGNQRLGLAWKRYDRLEWIHGYGEKQMFGTMALSRSHDLELRPKQHYPMSTRSRKGKPLEEPPPVEGFLIRLTSQRGRHQKMGKLFYKRLYFSTHDHYLVFSRPARVEPPPPPSMLATENEQIPSAHQMAEKIPLMYAVNPFPLEEGDISWLRSSSPYYPKEVARRDEDACNEMMRNNNILRDCDGFVDLVNIVKVRNVKLGTVEEDEGLDSGSELDFNGPLPPHATSDGVTTELNHDTTFELKLVNGLVIRLQAFNAETKHEWMKRLHKLIRYWKARHVHDLELYKLVRQRNLEALHIDEEAEAVIGQFARKWEVTQAYASPELYNICGISRCRSIHMSGPLYRKPRRRALFTGINCILIPGRLLIFSSKLRKHTGRSIPQIHQEKVDAIDLAGCYLYSGLLTEDDLLYQNQTFDSSHPGHHALPRMWVEDAWTSRDEDVMTSFVVWRPTSKSWFRRGAGVPGFEEGHRARLKRVSQLGVQGRTIVFKARSRVERDHWVSAIATEIERLQEKEDVRITESNEDNDGPRRS